MNTKKPEIVIASDNSGSPLPALELLLALRPNASYHEARDRRHPLGVYCLSVGRICDKVGKCADRLEGFWQKTGGPDNIHDDIDNIHDDIIDYLELAMYAAAEHVDDLELIAATFFRTDREAAASADVRLLKKAIKPLRDEIAAFTNTIKHSHGRLRLYETDFHHDGNSITVLGFFIEGFHQGGVAPHPVLHTGGKTVLSVTSFLWNILTYMGEMSTALAEFLRRIDASDSGEQPADTAVFRQTALKLARLPLYSFDEDHPFHRVRWLLHLDKAAEDATRSGIYGSLYTRWSKSSAGTFGGFRLLYGGDGATRTFKIVNPTKLRLQHWE